MTSGRTLIQNILEFTILLFLNHLTIDQISFCRSSFNRGREFSPILNRRIDTFLNHLSDKVSILIIQRLNHMIQHRYRTRECDHLIIAHIGVLILHLCISHVFDGLKIVLLCLLQLIDILRFYTKHCRLILRQLFLILKVSFLILIQSASR